HRWHKTPRSGDLVMFPHHVGLVENVYRNGTLTTIEGNSSNRVSRRWRRWSDASGYVRVAAGGSVVRGRQKPSAPRPAPVRARLVARITVHPWSTVGIGQNVAFTANDSSGDIVRYAWDLDGDGRFDDGRSDNALQRYARAGDVRVRLQVTDRRGRTDTATTTVKVRANKAPVAKLILPDHAPVGSEVVGHAEESQDPDGSVLRYEWDMDGDGRYEPGGDHSQAKYPRPGVYSVGLRVIDDRGTVSEVVETLEITHKPPVALASVPESVPLGASATVDGSRSYDPEGVLGAWRWDVGADGSIDAEGANPTLSFAEPGRHEVRLVVADQWGAEAVTSAWVDVINMPSVGQITGPERPVAGQALSFDASGSTDTDSNIVSYEWDFDEDDSWDASGAQAAWTYAGGQRKVRLRLTDQWGSRQTFYRLFKVLQPPEPKFALVTTVPLANRTTTFTAWGSSDPDGSIMKWSWDYDSDGRIDRVTFRPRSAWVYPKAGQWLATLTVTDDDGLTGTAQIPVVVGGG
ncbi:MAG: PKD domain-containing protein, partial [Actinomycetota bacterium]|nr:PKD domain-containing protein [Actinomycetota bacterium]